MKNNKLYIITVIVLLFILSTNIFAQKKSDDLGFDIDELIENIASDTDAGIDFDTYLEKLNDYVQHPINLNKANYYDLDDLGLLTPQEINAILDYREKMGDFIAIYELQAVPDLPLKSIRMIVPFVRAKDLDDSNLTFKDLLNQGDHQLYVRFQQTLEKAKGYKNLDTIYNFNVQDEEGITSNIEYDTNDSKPQGYEVLDTLNADPYSTYLGSPYRLYTRYRYNFGTRLSYGITAEKDPGEEFFRGTQKQGYDFYSAHFYLRDVGPFKHLALGDFEIRMGQGLIVYSSLGFGKGSYVMDVAKQGNPVKPYTSVNESFYFRGAAATLDLGNDIELTAFGSYKPVDGNIILNDTLGLIDGIILIGPSGSGDGDFAVSSRYNSGFHRRASEIDNKGAYRELMTGGILAIKKRRFTIALNGVYGNLNTSITPTARPSNLYAFRGSRYVNGSLDYKYLYRNFHFFGETAINEKGGIATVNGVLLGLDPKLSASIVHRYYDPKYYAPAPNQFSEGGSPSNESGLFIGAEFKPLHKWSVRAYMDFYKHPWVKTTAEAPSHGNDYLVHLEYRPSRKLTTYFRYRNEVKKTNLTGAVSLADYLVNQQKSSFRYHIQYSIAKAYTLRSRVEFSWFDGGDDDGLESGYMVYQDLIYKPLESPLTLSFRYALFDTDSYDTRIYAFENDLLYVYSAPAYSYRGSRFYAMVRYKLFRNTDVWLRLAQTHLDNRKTIGSGNEELEGSNRTEVKAMIRVKF